MSNEQPAICGFWRRILALVVDVLLLGIIGWMLGALFRDQFSSMGQWGRAVGFVIELAYFGLLNSRLGHGQTVGKRLLKIRVVDGNDQWLSLPRSMVRAIILALGSALNGIDPGHWSSSLFVMVPLSVLIFGSLGSTLYLYIFNRKTRQSLHDLLVGSYVVNTTPAANPAPRQAIWPWHRRLVVGIFILAAALPFFTLSLQQSPLFNSMLDAKRLLEAEPGVQRVFISTNVATFGTDAQQGAQQSVTAQLFMQQNRLQDEVLAKKLATDVVTHMASAKEADAVHIVLVYGYDIGIASNWSAEGYSFSPTQLLAPSSSTSQ